MNTEPKGKFDKMIMLVIALCFVVFVFLRSSVTPCVIATSIIFISALVYFFNKSKIINILVVANAAIFLFCHYLLQENFMNNITGTLQYLSTILIIAIATTFAGKPKFSLVILIISPALVIIMNGLTYFFV